MLEPPERDTTWYRCKQCLYEAIWPFQLDHHIQRSHTNVHVFSSLSIIAELELYHCIYCSDFNTCCKLSRYEHYIRKHGNNGNIRNNEEYKYSCGYCKHEWQSGLSIIKHSCKTANKDRLASRSTVSLDSDDVKPRNLILIDSSGGFHYNEVSLKRKAESKRDSADEIKKFRCAKCSYGSKRNCDVMRHMLTHAGSGEIKLFKCTKCSYRSTQEQSLKNHVKKTRGKCGEIKWFYCGTCSYRAKEKRNFTAHMLVHAPPEQINWYNCTNCTYRTKWKRDLRLHMLTHDPHRYDEVTWLNCAKCSFRTKIKKCLVNHMLVHETDPEFFYCSECSYRATRKASLRRHMRTHAASEEIEWFSCTKCVYRVRNKGRLERHMMTHAAGEEIKCNYTKSSYRAKSKSKTINDEVKVESYACADGSRWFSCTECSYRSNRKSNLKKHTAAIHAPAGDVEEIEWFSCTECSHRTKRKSCLKVHMITKHTSPEQINWFQCTECLYRAKIKDNLVVHMMNKHAIFL